MATKKKTKKSVKSSASKSLSVRAGSGTKGSNGSNGSKGPSTSKASSLPVLKTYKIFIGGKFPRTESGRYYQPEAETGALGNICLGSRKDLRNAVQAARKAQAGWAGRTAYNRSQILYRIGEMLEGRKEQFVAELVQQGASQVAAKAQVNEAIDRCVYYAGWCDKYQQIFSSVNPVASSHFNFTIQEPTGVVGMVAPSSSPLLGLVGGLLPIIAGGNTAVVIADEDRPLSAISFAEVLATSDVPGGVVNIITGKRAELLKPMVQHMDVNAILVFEAYEDEMEFVDKESVSNLKRAIFPETDNWFEEESKSPYAILRTQEAKTTWHPIEVIGSSGSGY